MQTTQNTLVHVGFELPLAFAAGSVLFVKDMVCWAKAVLKRSIACIKLIESYLLGL